MKIPIKEVNYGIACCINDNGKKWIEINKHLKHYSKLYKTIITHETAHYNSNGLLDFKIELGNMFNLKTEWALFKFSIKHPEAFYDLLPIFYNKKAGVNWFVLLSYLVLLAIFGGIICLL